MLTKKGKNEGREVVQKICKNCSKNLRTYTLERIAKTNKRIHPATLQGRSTHRFSKHLHFALSWRNQSLKECALATKMA